jgi:two-component system sensor histidine kinase RegB
MDDGPGFSAEIFEQIGEPYVTSRPSAPKSIHSDFGKEEGMGLGFFIAKTLIEQTGGTVTARNRNRGGAIVTVRWPRGGIDGDAPPREEFHL